MAESSERFGGTWNTNAPEFVPRQFTSSRYRDGGSGHWQNAGRGRGNGHHYQEERPRGRGQLAGSQSEDRRHWHGRGSNRNRYHDRNENRNYGFGYNDDEYYEHRPSQNRSSGSNRNRNRRNGGHVGEVNSDNLKASLSDQLANETYECGICYERIRWTNAVWSCQLCYRVLHLRCAKQWANKCMNEEGSSASVPSGEWRCPGCQTVNGYVPNDYNCFCGKMKNPTHERWAERGNASVPHTCGELCQKRRANDCPHPCNDLCHPGPCDQCPLTVNKQCKCGKQSRRVRCGSEPFQCGEICEKLLNCGIHKCQRVCHSGECEPCREEIIQGCFCGQSQRLVFCGDKSIANGALYSCDALCGKLHTCGIHYCLKKCHDGDCGPCPFDPAVVNKCCCGKLTLQELSITRNSCSDPLPVCPNICAKKLSCGEEGSNHTCQSKCHSGPCPQCPLSTSARCRCGATTKSLPCSQLAQYNAEHPLLCERRCSKKKTCKQHKCNEVCCVEMDHICTQVCGRKLSCGIHTCEALCHGGKCRPCPRMSFDELTCVCGAAVLYPPVPCGTKPPSCDRLCTRQHLCDHPVAHNCHSDSKCPPCTYLTAKMCYGKHEVRKNIPCYLDDISCGKPCGQPLPCGQHVCIRPCHPGRCCADDDQCIQPCVRPRAVCGHPCAVKCHGDSPCPEETICQFAVKVTCKCGHVTTNMACYEIDRLASQRFMGKAAKADTKHEIDFDELARQDSVERYKCLDCTEECARIERNRRFVEALDIQSDDLVGEFGPPPYPDFLKEQFKMTPDFLFSIEKTFMELISTADKAKQQSRSYVFPPMNRNQRRVIHEYAPYFEIDTIAYDQEPQRNVVATAKKGKSKVPSILLSAVVQKENAKPASRVVPPKANHVDTVTSPSSGMKTLQSTSGIILRR